MAERNCKKCFHYNACKEVASHSGYTDINYTESQCENFICADDVVKVVRCKDCKHLMKDIVTEETPYGFDEDRYVFGCRKFFESSGEWVDVMLDDYCSGGERRCYEPDE